MFQSQYKAIAGAIVGIIVALLTQRLGITVPTETQGWVTEMLALCIGAAVGWAGVYFAPANKKKMMLIWLFIFPTMLACGTVQSIWAKEQACAELLKESKSARAGYYCALADYNAAKEVALAYVVLPSTTYAEAEVIESAVDEGDKAIGEVRRLREQGVLVSANMYQSVGILVQGLANRLREEATR